MPAYLLDTHVVLWHAQASPRLSNLARKQLTAAGVERYVTVVSLWEITVKHQIGKINLTVPLEDFLADIVQNGDWQILPVTPAHIYSLGALPLLHKDPFDRLLVAQARAEGLTLLTADPRLAAYGIPTAW